MTISEGKIWDIITNSWPKMSFEQKRLWGAVRIIPEKWTLKNYGDCWTVALVGAAVVYYNEYENGFGCSSWAKYGVIEHYDSSQRDLEKVVQSLINRIKDGYDSAPRSGPPIAGEYPGSGER